MVHYDDFDPVSFRTVLTLHKDVLYHSNSQHIGGWHDLPAEQQRDEQRIQSLNRHKIYSIGRNFCPKYMQTLLDSVSVTDPMLEKHAIKVPLWWIKQYKVSSRVSYKYLFVSPLPVCALYMFCPCLPNILSPPLQVNDVTIHATLDHEKKCCVKCCGIQFLFSRERSLPGSQV